MTLSPPILNDKNFLLYAIKNYDNPTCTSVDEFHQDIRRIKYIKKLVTRAQQSSQIKTRLILNHLIVLSNVFPPDALARILYLKMKEQIHYIKPFLIMLGLLPKYIYNVEDVGTIDTDLIPMDQRVIDELRKI